MQSKLYFASLAKSFSSLVSQKYLSSMSFHTSEPGLGLETAKSDFPKPKLSA